MIDARFEDVFDKGLCQRGIGIGEMHDLPHPKKVRVRWFAPFDGKVRRDWDGLTGYRLYSFHKCLSPSDRRVAQFVFKLRS